MILTWCVTTSLKKSFQTFPQLLIRRYMLEWWQELLQEYLLFMHNAIAHAQLNVLRRIIVMSTSAADLIGTCACAQEVQFKWIFLFFFGNVSTSVTFEMHHSRKSWTLLRQVKTNSLFFSQDVYLRPRWDYQPSSSSYLTSSGEDRW